MQMGQMEQQQQQEEEKKQQRCHWPFVWHRSRCSSSSNAAIGHLLEKEKEEQGSSKSRCSRSGCSSRWKGGEGKEAAATLPLAFCLAEEQQVEQMEQQQQMEQMQQESKKRARGK